MTMRTGKMDGGETPERWEAAVRALAEGYPYPPTPDLAGRVRGRLAASPAAGERRDRPAWQRPALVFAALLLILALALSVPAVRAAVREWLQIGAIRIVVTPPAEMATAPAEATASALFGEPMTLQEAHTRAGFALRLPTAEPADREPDRIYVQDLPDLAEQPGAKATIAVWNGEPALSLYQIQGPHYGMKVAWANALAETSVDGQLAYWVGGPHPLLLGNGERWSIVAGDVLVWADGTYTYRLESSLSMEEAVRVAESLK